jgi:hypothetical protein
LIPRIGDRKLDLRFFGHSYTYCLVNCGGRLHIFLETPTHPTTLKTFFGVRERGYGDLLKLFGGVLWIADFRLKRVDDAWFSDLIISDLPGLVNSLDSPGGICVSVSRSSELAPLLIRRVAALYRKALKEGDPVLRLRASAMQKKIPKLLLGRVLALASGGGELRKLCGLVRESSTIDLRWVTRKVVDGEGLSVLLRPPRVGFWDKLLGLRGRVLLNEELIDEIVKLPDPSLHKVEFTREFLLPPVPPRRVSPRSFRIGSLEDGSEFRLDVEDLRRHAYLIGQTGSGKTFLAEAACPQVG